MEKMYRVQMNSKGMPNFSTAVEVADIPNADRPQGEWVPCSERVPKWKEHTDDMVLVCYADGSVRFNTCISGEWVQGEPIAWMPLPEPWKGADYE